MFHLIFHSNTLDASDQRWPVSELATPRTSCYNALLGQRCTLESSKLEHVWAFRPYEIAPNVSYKVTHVKEEHGVLDLDPFPISCIFYNYAIFHVHLSWSSRLLQSTDSGSPCDQTLPTRHDDIRDALRHRGRFRHDRRQRARCVHIVRYQRLPSADGVHHVGARCHGYGQDILPGSWTTENGRLRDGCRRQRVIDNSVSFLSPYNDACIWNKSKSESTNLSGFHAWFSGIMSSLWVKAQTYSKTLDSLAKDWTIVP